MTISPGNRPNLAVVSAVEPERSGSDPALPAPQPTDADRSAELTEIGLTAQGADALASPSALTVMTALLGQGLELGQIQQLVADAERLAQQAAAQLQATVAGFGATVDAESALTLARLVCADVLTAPRSEPEHCCRSPRLRLVPPTD